MKTQLTKLLSLSLCLLGCSICSYAQGIKWTEGLNWEQIKSKAKAEHKYIFIDAYATWCAPCRKMDNEVYLEKSIGIYFNARFISIKLQMDTSKIDSKMIRKQYQLAADISKNYQVHSFPTFLFFSPNGEIVHRDEGFTKADAFLLVGQRALDSNCQFYTILRRFKDNRLPNSEKPVLYIKAQQFGDKILANSVGTDYITQYENKIGDAEFLHNDNVLFMEKIVNLVKVDDEVFQRYKRNQFLIDSIKGKKGYVKKILNSIVSRSIQRQDLEIVNKSNVEPEWDSLYLSLIDKYGFEYTDNIEDNFFFAKIAWYKRNKIWSKYAKYLSIKTSKSLSKNEIDLKNVFSAAVLNNSAWSIFQYSEDKTELQIAIKWVNILLELDPNDFQVMDTKANLLYKAKNVKEAIALEEALLRKSLEFYKNESNSFIEETKNTLQKMKSGLPTW